MEGKFSFIFKDVDEFLYLINLKALNMVNPIPEFSIHEMGFINEVYIYERLDLGLPYNFMHFNLVNDDFLWLCKSFNNNFFQDSKYIDLYKDLKIFIYHFAGWKPEVICKVTFSNNNPDQKWNWIYFKDASYKENSPCSNYKSHVESLKKINISIKSWNENPDKTIQHILNLQKSDEGNQILNITYDVFKVTSDIISKEENTELIKSGRLSRNGWRITIMMPSLPLLLHCLLLDADTTSK